MKNIFQYKKLYSRLLAVAVAGSKSGLQAGFGAGAKFHGEPKLKQYFRLHHHHTSQHSSKQLADNVPET
jgi:hypothetical protein